MFGINDDNSNPVAADNVSSDPATIVEPVMRDDNLEESETAANDYPVSAPTVPLPTTDINDPPDEVGRVTNPVSSDNADDLLSIKQQALKDLSPLVDNLDQSAEEKFHTMMMMIQASDDKSLLPAAYKAAQSISDDKLKAQALLDVINEINYFTQKNQ